MNKPNHYKWLFIVEGNTDVNTYSKLFSDYNISKNDFSLLSTKGKGFVCNSATWGNSNLLKTIQQDIGRKNFIGIILLVDTDSDGNRVFDAYERNLNLPYAEAVKPNKENKGMYWLLDNLNGANKIPIYGISVPVATVGCLETDLLNSYGFPVEGQDEYATFLDIIKKSTCKWQIPLKKNGKKWWEDNSKAKFDKFIYSALYHGFYVSRRNPIFPTEPDVIKNIKSVILNPIP